MGKFLNFHPLPLHKSSFPLLVVLEGKLYFCSLFCSQMNRHKHPRPDHNRGEAEEALLEAAVGITQPRLLLLQIIPAQVSSQPGVNPATFYSLVFLCWGLRI